MASVSKFVLATAAALALGSTPASAAVVIVGGSVVNLAVPTPTVSSTGLTINFGQEPIGAAQNGAFSFKHGRVCLPRQHTGRNEHDRRNNHQRFIDWTRTRLGHVHALYCWE